MQMHTGQSVDAALQKASANGHADTVKVLLAAGAHVRAKEDWAVRWAAKNGHAETVAVLQEWITRGEQESGL